jgi:hypothetical protein
MALKAVSAPLGSPVGGSGTTNYIPRWNPGPSTLGDSGLIDDSTSIYTSTRRVGVDTSTTLANVKLQVGTAASLANYQGAPLGVVLPAGSGSWLELAENSASGTSFRISKDSSTGVVLNTNGKTIGFTAAGYTTAISSSQVVLTTTGNVGIGTASPTTFAASGSVVIGQNLSSQQWALKIFGGNDANRAPVISLFRSGNAEAVIAQIKDGARAVLALGTGGGIANFNDATLVTYCPVKIGPDYTDMSGASYGLKLPATPGNADTQTLDAYKESTTWAPTVTWGTGGTVTTTSATGAYTQIGNVVTFTVTIAYNCSVVPTGGSIAIDLPRTSATGFNQRPGLWAFNAWNGVAGSNFLSIGSASTTATLRVANATGTADIATYLTVTASGALVITATYLAS